MCLVRMDRRNVDRSGETDGIGINSKVLAASLVSTDGYKSVGKSMPNQMLLQGPLKCDYLPKTDGDQGWLNRNGSSDLHCYSDTHFSDPMSADILDEDESSSLEIMVSKPASVNKLLNNSSMSSDSHPMATAFVSSEPQTLELSVYEYCKQLIDNPSEKLEKFVKDEKEMTPSKIENTSVLDIDCCKPSGAESFDQSQGPVRKCGIIRRKKTQQQLNGILTKPLADYFSPISTNNSMQEDLKESNAINSANPSFHILTVNAESSSNLTKPNIPDLPVNDTNSTINTSMASTATPDVQIEVDSKPPRDILSEKEKKAALPQSTSLDMPVHCRSSCAEKDLIKVETDSIEHINSSESHENNTPIKTSTEENSASTSNTGERYTSPKFSASKGPRAKKSISFHFKENTQESLSSSVTRDILSASVASPASDSNNESKSSLSNMTIKVGELENALGLHFKSLDKLDAKTLDKIVLAMAQENSKTRSGAKFGSSSRHSKRSERATLFNKTVLAAASSAGAVPQPPNSPSKLSNPIRESGSSSGLLASKAASPNPNGNSCLNQQKNCSARKSVVHPVSKVKNIAGKCDNLAKPFSPGTITNGHMNSKSEGLFSSRRKIQKARKTQAWSFNKAKLLSLSSSNGENFLEDKDSIVGTLSRLSSTNGCDGAGSVGTGKKKFANLRKSSESNSSNSYLLFHCFFAKF